MSRTTGYEKPSPGYRPRSIDPATENLLRFLAILREWDSEARLEASERRARELVARCFTEGAGSGKT